MKLEKHGSILSLLEQLPLEGRGWIVEDHWEGDLCAVGIVNPRLPGRLVYVSTYGKQTGRYYYECEVPHPEYPDDSQEAVEMGEDVGFSDLLKVMRHHLDP